VDKTRKIVILIFFNQLKESVGLFNLVRIKDDLEEKLNKKVDLVSEKYINPKLKPYVMNDLEIIYSNER